MKLTRNVAVKNLLGEILPGQFKKKSEKVVVVKMKARTADVMLDSGDVITVKKNRLDAFQTRH